MVRGGRWRPTSPGFLRRSASTRSSRPAPSERTLPFERKHRRTSHVDVAARRLGSRGHDIDDVGRDGRGADLFGLGWKQLPASPGRQDADDLRRRHRLYLGFGLRLAWPRWRTVRTVFHRALYLSVHAESVRNPQLPAFPTGLFFRALAGG